MTENNGIPEDLKRHNQIVRIVLVVVFFTSLFWFLYFFYVMPNDDLFTLNVTTYEDWNNKCNNYNNTYNNVKSMFLDMDCNLIGYEYLYRNSTFIDDINVEQMRLYCLKEECISDDYCKIVRKYLS